MLNRRGRRFQGFNLSLRSKLTNNSTSSSASSKTEAAHSEKSEPSGGYSISSADVFCTSTMGSPALSVIR